MARTRALAPRGIALAGQGWESPTMADVLDSPMLPVALPVRCPVDPAARTKRLRSANGPVAIVVVPSRAPAPTRGDTADAPDLDSITIS